MKLRLSFVALALLLLLGCTPNPPANPDTAAPNTENTETQTPDGSNTGTPSNPSAQNGTEYNENGIRFNIPKTWAKNGFEPAVRETGTGGDAYRILTFYCTLNEQRIPVLTISRFDNAQWDQLVKADQSAESVKLGTNKDKTAVYTFFLEKLDQFDAGTAKDTLNQIYAEAEALRKNIKITK